MGFRDLFRGAQCQTIMKMQSEHGRICGLWSSRPTQNNRPKNPSFFPGFFRSTKTRNEAGPFVPAFKTWLLVYLSEERKIIELNTNPSNLNFPFLRPVDPNDPGGWILGAKLETYFCKTWAGFGRTELSLRLSCTELCALSSGHGPRSLGFYGGPSGRIFCILGNQKWKETWKSRMNMVRFWSPELSMSANWSPKKSRKIQGFSDQKTLNVKEILIFFEMVLPHFRQGGLCSKGAFPGSRMFET